MRVRVCACGWMGGRACERARVRACVSERVGGGAGGRRTVAAGRADVGRS